MARSYTFVSDEVKKDMNECFAAGLKCREIRDLTGVPLSTVSRYRRKWAKDSDGAIFSAETSEAASEPEAKVDEGIFGSDYAKAYLANDAAVIRSDFDVSEKVVLRSKKTDILYEATIGDDDLIQVIRITLADGQKVDIELGLFERFVDEGIDVFIEMKKRMKK